MARNPECPCRQPAKDFAFGYQSVEPGQRCSRLRTTICRS